MSVEERLSRVLGGWAAGSVVGGALLMLRPGTRGFGRQTLVWGAIDGAIAYVGVRGRRRKGLTDPVRLRTVLLVNAALDLGYLALGRRMLGSERWRRDGQAVLVQGAFLLVLDSVSAYALKD